MIIITGWIGQSDKILTLTNAAEVELEPIWATLLAKALEGKDVKDLLSNVGAGGGAPAASSGAVAAGGGAAAEEKVEEKKEEAKEESDDDMVSPLVFFVFISQIVDLSSTSSRVSVYSIRHPISCSFYSFSLATRVIIEREREDQSL
jgi:large subunit ribosomal protein LP1